MKATTKYLIALAVLVGIDLWLVNSTEADNATSKQNTEMTFVISECDLITEKAATNLVAVVEFQKLEIAGRKSAVFKTCMKDRGYIENPAWTKYAIPIAEKTAKSTNISVDEAFENLRRANMMAIIAKQDEPLFWVQSRLGQ